MALNDSGKKKTAGSLFLVEIIIALLFFSISGAVILRVFAAADSKMHSVTTNDSIILCAQSLAEAYSVGGSASAAAVTVFGEEFTPDSSGTLTIPLDSQCRLSEHAEITLTLTERCEGSRAGTLKMLSISFSGSGGEIQRLECSAYIPAGGGGS